jgi:putative membrane protein
MSDAEAAATEEVESKDSAIVGEDEPLALLGIRSAIGGVLMGLANLVPGISGGTMLLASGVYPKFIAAIAEVSTFKFKKRSLVVLGVIVLSALLAIGGLAGVVKDLVVSHRWVMYSLFIGLTLGGVPVVWKLAKPATPATWIGAVIGFVPMAVLAWFQMQGPQGTADASGFLMMFLAGAAAASAMILPGVSGGYLLLVMGVYVSILSGVDEVKEALKAMDMEALMGPFVDVVLPVGLGVLVGVLLISNLLEKMLERFEKGTLGGLLGLLVGAVVGLWPFQVGVAPEIGDTFKGQVVTAELLTEIEPEKYPTEFFSPGGMEIGGALGLIVVGFALTALIAKLGAGKDAAKAEAAAE